MPLWQVDEPLLQQVLPTVVGELGSPQGFQVLEGGTNNTVVGVRIGPGTATDVVVKISPPRTSPALSFQKDLLPTEGDYFRRARAYGVPVPQVLTEGHDIIAGRDHIVETKLPGRRWCELKDAATDEQRRDVRRQIGRAVALAHQAPCEGFGYMGPGGRPSGQDWTEAFTAMIDALLNDAERFGVSFPSPPDRIRGLLRAAHEAFREIKTPVLVHFDLWDGNILVQPNDEGLTVSGILDAECALHGDAAFELPSLSLLSEDLREGGFVIDDGWLQGYREVGGELPITPGLQVRTAFYRVYLYMVMLVEVVPRQEGPNAVAWRDRECVPVLERDLRWLDGQLG